MLSKENKVEIYTNSEIYKYLEENSEKIEDKIDFSDGKYNHIQPVKLENSIIEMDSENKETYSNSLETINYYYKKFVDLAQDDTKSKETEKIGGVFKIHVEHLKIMNLVSDYAREHEINKEELRRAYLRVIIEIITDGSLIRKAEILDNQEIAAKIGEYYRVKDSEELPRFAYDEADLRLSQDRQLLECLTSDTFTSIVGVVHEKGDITVTKHGKKVQEITLKDRKSEQKIQLWEAQIEEFNKEFKNGDIVQFSNCYIKQHYKENRLVVTLCKNNTTTKLEREDLKKEQKLDLQV
jgi:hypothetical protein